ncbi:MAG: hypothetical protein IT168_13870 [Bryobacterales bacterium]|nr:hypothetical protein [Bryobacterales bacterium]
MSALRRDFFKLAGGAAAGLMFTPVPWRLLGDSAMWTQNWSWLPKVPRGPVTDRTTRCTLCRAACPVRAHCAGGLPTGLWPAGQPLCPAGFAAHHFSYHAARLRKPSAPLPEIVKMLKRRSGAGLAVLDLAPGRTSSYAVRNLLNKVPGAIFTEPAPIEGATAQAVSRLLSKPAPLALDLANLRTLLSVRTPVMEGWASPKFVNAGPLKFHLLQVEPVRTHTAEIAAEWIQLPAGQETPFLLAVAGELLKRTKSTINGLELLKTVSAGAAHPAAARVAELLLANRPSAVLADGDPANGPLDKATVAVAAAINVLLGSPLPGGFVPRAEAPIPAQWTPVPVTGFAAIPNQSIRTLIVDEPVPGCSVNWDLIRPKLASDALVVGVTWTAEGACRHATCQVPGSVFLEAVHDAPPAVDSAAAQFAVSRPFLPPMQEATDTVALVGRLAGEDTNLTAAIQERAAAIRTANRGAVTKVGEVEPAPVASFKKDEEFWTALEEGAAWTDSAPAPYPAAARLVPQGATPADFTSTRDSRPVRNPGWRPAAASPLIAKLWRESGLRKSPGERLS